MKGFKNFLMQGDLILIAVGLVIALGFSTLIKSFTDNVITPLVNAIGGGGTNGLGFTVKGQLVNIGAFISAVIYFIIFVAVMSFPTDWNSASDLSPSKMARSVHCIQRISPLGRITRCSIVPTGFSVDSEEKCFFTRKISGSGMGGMNLFPMRSPRLFPKNLRYASFAKIWVPSGRKRLIISVWTSTTAR